jgi:hypothetical protein
VCESSVSFYKWVQTLAIGERSTLWRGRAPVGETAPLWGRARPFGGGLAPLGEGMFTLTWWVRKGAPLLQRARPFGKGLFQSVTMNFNLLIQHTVSRWSSSCCVHEGCGGVDRWLQTDNWSSEIFFYRQPSRQASTKSPPSCTETAELLDADFFTVKSIPELK